MRFPVTRLPAIAPLIVNLPAETVIIDTSNYYSTPNNTIDVIKAGQVESLWVVEQLGRPIVKAWNAIGTDSFARLGTTKGSPNRIALPVAVDRETDRDVGMALVKDTGFDTFDAGPLADSWRQQPGAPAYCTDITAEELPAALATADAARSPKQRDLAMTVIAERLVDNITTLDGDYLVRLNQALYR